jgi:hypothetical protein
MPACCRPWFGKLVPMLWDGIRAQAVWSQVLAP